MLKSEAAVEKIGEYSVRKRSDFQKLLKITAIPLRESNDLLAKIQIFRDLQDLGFRARVDWFYRDCQAKDSIANARC